MSKDGALNLPGVVKDLKLKVAESFKEIQRWKDTVVELENLPVVHNDLQGRVQDMVRALYYFQMAIYSARKQASIETHQQILQQDLKDLFDRKVTGKQAKPG